MAILISSSLFPTIENTIFLGFIPALITFKSSPPEQHQHHSQVFSKLLKLPKFVLAFVAKKQTNGLTVSKVLRNLNNFLLIDFLNKDKKEFLFFLAILCIEEFSTKFLTNVSKIRHNL